MSILLFFLVLFVLILVHEWGHFIAAKKTGMRVDEFGIGFPPRLFSFKKGETLYSFNALPIGGFVKILGENGEEGVELSEADKARTFSARPKWAQAVVLIAGVTMNVLFAWLLFSATFMMGIPTAVDESSASPAAELMVASVMADSPADNRIPAGAVITKVTAGTEAVESPTPTSFAAFVSERPEQTLTIDYRFGDSVESATIVPVTGLDEANPERAIVGVSLALVEQVSQPLHTALKNGFTATTNGLVAITVGLFDLIKQSFTGDADFTQVAGPIGIVGMVDEAAAYGLTALLTFTAIISLNLAVVNLLPFPALDGGRLVFVAIETVTGKQIPPEWAGRANLVGFALLMLLMIAVTYNDIIKLL